LIIEDEILIQKSIKRLLESRGHLVDAVSLGSEAIEFARNKQYDRIVCDLMLKDITGFEILEEFKNFMTVSDIGNKVIIMTAYSSESILKTASTYSCKVLKKPFLDLNKAIDIFINGEK